MKRYLLFCLLFISVVPVNAQCWKYICAGWDVNVGIKTDGTLWGWGTGSGALGNYSGFSIPTQIGTATNWRSVSICSTHAAGIQSNGTLWLWGDNLSGELGNGTLTSTLVPTQLGTATDWLSVVTGDRYTLAIKTNGTLWAWGENGMGQLGDGTQVDKLVPVQIGTDTDWKSVSSRYVHTMALKTNGTLWSWGGNNFSGALGLGVVTGMVTQPTQVGTDSDWQSVSASWWRHGAAIKTNGTLWSWGENFRGELGDGTNITRYTPVQVGSATDWQSVSTGYVYTLAIKTNGTLWSWGVNVWGQLGNGTNINTNSPGQVGTVSTWQVASSGFTHSLGLRTDGTLWAWGRNDAHQLGINDTLKRNVPVEVFSPSITVNATSISACAGASLALTASGAVTYTWTSGVSNGVPFVPASSGVYTVTGSDVNGCYNTATVAVTVIPNTTVTANATSNNVCTGGTVSLTGSGGGPYVWSGGITDGVSFTPTTTSTYTVTDATGCSNTASITVNVLPLPVVSVNSVSICAGSNALLTASVNPATGTTYSWSQSSTGNPVTVSPSTTASYTVTATNGGCSASAVASVSVVPVIVPVTGFSYASPLCLTASNPLPTGAPGFSSGGIYSSGAGITTDPLTGQIDLSNSSAGTYVVTYSVAANGCNPAGSSTASVSLNAPVAAVTGFSYLPVCSNGADPAPLLNSGFTAGGNFSGPGLALNAGSGIINLSATAPGTYTVTYNVSAANCVLAGTGTAGVVINPAPVLSVSSSTLIYTGDQTTLTANSSANTYTWSPATGLTCSDCAMPVASPAESTIYCVRTTDGVCTNSACITVVVESFCEGDQGFFLPNAFSPNNDGNNDVLCVQGRNRCVSNFQMIIYNRWGEKVFESSDLPACWDGTYKGKALSPDVFVYYIKAQDKNQKEVIKKGNVTLIK